MFLICLQDARAISPSSPVFMGEGLKQLLFIGTFSSISASHFGMQSMMFHLELKGILISTSRQCVARAFLGGPPYICCGKNRFYLIKELSSIKLDPGHQAFNPNHSLTL